jgi:hypothetical protein
VDYITCKVENWVGHCLSPDFVDVHCSKSKVGNDLVTGFYGAAITPSLIAFLVIAFFASDCWSAAANQSSNSSTKVRRTLPLPFSFVALFLSLDSFSSLPFTAFLLSFLSSFHSLVFSLSAYVIGWFC